MRRAFRHRRQTSLSRLRRRLPPSEAWADGQGSRGVLLLVALCGACGEGLPLPERIAHIRPLAVRVEVVEERAAETPARTEAFPFERVVLEPFIVSPEGVLTAEQVAELVDPVWLLCVAPPAAGLFTCVRQHLPTSLESLPPCPTEIAFNPGDPESMRFPDLCRVEAEDPAAPILTVPFDPLMFVGGDLDVTMIGHRSDETTTQSCARALLSGSSDIHPECMFVSQRVSVGPDARLVQLAQEFGFEGSELLPPAPETPPDPDTHPRIEAVQLEHAREDGTIVDVREVPSGTHLVAQPGDVFELAAVTREADLQSFYIVENQAAFVEIQEDYAGRWYRTWGELLTPDTDDPISLNRWRLVPGEQDEPQEGPPGDVAYLFYVVRDGRQGVDWWWASVELEAQ